MDLKTATLQYLLKDLVMYNELSRLKSPYLQKPTYRPATLFKAPSRYFVQFIGGPLNSVQNFFPATSHPLSAANGKIYRFLLPQKPLSPLEVEMGLSPEVEALNYQITLVPREETPFLEDEVQLAIALFRN